MSNATQRKRRTTSTSTSRRNNSKRSQTRMSQAVMETIDVLENERTNSEDVVDLTCEGSEPAVVDLTNNDSVVVVEDGVQNTRAQGTESYVLSSDEEEDSSLRMSPGLLSSLHASSKARSTPGAVSCPICMDAYSEIIDSADSWSPLNVVICSAVCAYETPLSRAHSCPTCRKKLTHKQYHPIYI